MAKSDVCQPKLEGGSKRMLHRVSLLPGYDMTTGRPSLQFVLTVALCVYTYIDFVWELLDRVVYKTLYGNPLDFSKIYNIVMNDEIKFTYFLFSVYLSVLCSFEAILSDLSSVRFPQ